MIVDCNMPNLKSEEEFGDLFIDSPSLVDLCGSKDFYYTREFKTSLGIPDYVLLNKKDYCSLSEFAKKYNGMRISGRYAAVISYVAKSEIVSTNEISQFFRQKRHDILRSLGELEEWGVVKFEDHSMENVMINVDFKIPQLHTVAIELKLSSWEKALWQAVRNSGQFSSSFVIMPSNKLDLLNSKKELFSLNGVGTAVLDVESLDITQVNSPVVTSAITSRFYLQTLGNLMQNLPYFSRITCF